MIDNTRYPNREQLVAARRLMTYAEREQLLLELAEILADLGADRERMERADELAGGRTQEATRRASGRPGATLP